MIHQFLFNKLHKGLRSILELIIITLFPRSKILNFKDARSQS